MENLSIITVILAAAADSINPCAIGVLVFMLTFLFSIQKDPKRVLVIGLTYISVVYLSYFAAGLGLIRILSSLPFLEILYKLTGLLLLGAGILDIWDGLRKTKKPLLAIPKSASPIIKKYIQRATIPAAIILGMLVSLFELPCTGGVYIAILSIISRSGLTGQGILLLALYNFIFVLPLLVIMVLVTRGLSSEKVQAWKDSNKSAMRILIGISMVILAVLILSDIL
ncbi:MAG: cytochrome c biogenesis protein CcdA [Candidatus Dojkabacteria bacterium]|nr:cytochrome c biogenesis protein CcdA [Candidatus Dojkabacteria bacterium]